MNIKDSKFYRPINILQTTDGEQIKLYDKYEILTYGSPYSTLLDDLMGSINLRGDGLVIQRDKLKHLQKK